MSATAVTTPFPTNDATASPVQTNDGLTFVGRIVRLQVQPVSLKVRVASVAHYDPSTLRSVECLLIDQDGVRGMATDGEEIIDIHNRRHAHSKNREGANGISLGFTSHYAAMRSMFGPHLTDGLAGENMLIATDRSYTARDLQGDLVIMHGGQVEAARVQNVIVAAPCTEFATWAIELADTVTPAKLRSALQFLHNGQRGYYALPASADPAKVHLGDEVFFQAH